MNKRGFTLIELLAVIVILAIIALIAVPIVLNIIDESKESATLRSADFYLDAVELSIADRVMHHGAINDGLYPIMSNGNICLGEYNTNVTPKTCAGKPIDSTNEKVLEVEVKGEKPTSGSIYIKGGQIFKEIDEEASNKKTMLVIGGQTIEPIEENGEVKFGIVDTNNDKEESTGPTLASCEFKEGTEKDIGAKYECDFGDGKRKFYILDLGTNPVNSNLEDDEVALILEGNYDTETQYWCDQEGANPSDNVCNADGLTPKLNEIREAWKSKLKAEQIVLPSALQIIVANNPTKNTIEYTEGIQSWLYSWDNSAWGNTVYGYWTSSPSAGSSSRAWYVGSRGIVRSSDVGNGGYGVRPVVNLKI